MTPAERQLLTDLRRTLLHLHKTLLDWEHAAYQRVHGRSVTGHELLHAILNDPQFAWLRPVSELIVRIDQALDVKAQEPDRRPVDVAAIFSQARALVAPDEEGSVYAKRYHTALQELPDAVFAHRAVADLLKTAPPERTH